MSLNKAYEKMKYDRRLLDLNLRLGQITQEEYDTYVNNLPDVGDNSEKINIEDSKSETADFGTHQLINFKFSFENSPVNRAIFFMCDF